MEKIFLASNFYSVSSTIASILENKQKGNAAFYITTASECEAGGKSWLDADRVALNALGITSQDYTITGKNQEDFERDFTGIQTILLSGGNVFYLLEQAQKSGFDSFIHSFIQREETIYFGSSAGAAIAGSTIAPLHFLDDPTQAPALSDFSGFGLIDACLFPHWGSENFKEKYQQTGFDWMYKEMGKSLLLTNTQFASVHTNGSFTLIEL